MYNLFDYDRVLFIISATLESEKCDIPQIRAEDYELHEAEHSDDGNITSGQDEEDDDAEGDNNYDLDDSFLDNNTQSPANTQQRMAYRKVLKKTPKHQRNKLKRLLNSDLKKMLSQIRRTESAVADESNIDSEYEWDGMEGYEDPNDPILSPWNAEKHGLKSNDKEELTSSDDDVCCILH